MNNRFHGILILVEGNGGKTNKKEKDTIFISNKNTIYYLNPKLRFKYIFKRKRKKKVSFEYKILTLVYTHQKGGKSGSKLNYKKLINILILVYQEVSRNYRSSL